MSFKYIVLIIVGLIILVLMNGCERGVGREPVDVNVSEKDLLGTWVVSKQYTNKNIVENLGSEIKERYFIIKPNNELIYHSFNAWLENINDPKVLKLNGKWEFIGKDVQLKGFHIGSIYIDSRGIYFTDKNNPNIQKPMKIETSKGFKNLYRFRITKKNNKLLLWEYEGDPDARRYIMYEKKE